MSALLACRAKPVAALPVPGLKSVAVSSNSIKKEIVINMIKILCIFAPYYNHTYNKFNLAYKL